jgi:hypothetical protein
LTILVALGKVYTLPSNERCPGVAELVRIVPANLPVCPVMIEEQEVQRRTALDELLPEIDSGMERINGFLGIASDGRTSNELF